MPSETKANGCKEDVYTMLDKEKIGARLGALRKSRGFSQALLSERLNVSPQAVSKWETGQSIPDLETLVAFGQ